MNDTATQAMASPTAKELLFEASANIRPQSKNVAMDAVEDIIFGSVAGIAGKIIEYPFDTVKVRLQSQSDHHPLRYKGPLDCFRQSIRSEGFLGLYRGISAPLVGAALEISSLFVFEQLAQKAFFSYNLYDSEKPLPLSALYLTGAISGAFTSLVLTPVELVKCKMQVPAVTTSDGMIARRPTPLSIIGQVYRYQGIKGFWNGQLGTLIRETGGCAAWFGSKETVTVLFRRLNEVNGKTDSTISSATQLAPLPIWQQAVAGAAAGVTYNFVFFPADTVKSRMQTTTVESAVAPMTFWKESTKLWQQHGIKGFYRGCGITVLRAAPSSAFIFIIYDGLKRHFHLS